jgi:hypothetical protein
MKLPIRGVEDMVYRALCDLDERSPLDTFAWHLELVERERASGDHHLMHRELTADLLARTQVAIAKVRADLEATVPEFDRRMDIIRTNVIDIEEESEGMRRDLVDRVRRQLEALDVIEANA